MIGKIKRGKSFFGVCKYILNQNKQVPGKIIGGNMAGQTPLELAREFELVVGLNGRVKVPVKHFSLSFAETDERVSDEVKNLLAMDYMEQMGYGNSQYVVVSHDRTDHDHNHDHIHIVANSVAMDGRWVNDRLDWKRSQTVLRTLESEYDLTLVASSWNKDRDKLVASRVDRRVERLLAGGVELSEIERTHAEIQSKIDLAALDAISMTQFCARLQALEINPVAKITRTGKVQGISYQSGNVFVRGSDLKGASFPALQQRGIKFDSARDLANLKSAVKGDLLETDREWMENLPLTIEAKNLAVTAELGFTHLEVPQTAIVATEIEVTPVLKRDLVQERKDNDLLFVAADYPELKKTPAYQEAKQRANDRYREQLKSMPNRRVAKLISPEPAMKKWQPILQQPTAPLLLESIHAAAQVLGANDYQAGNYRVRILADSIKVEYQNKLAMVIEIGADETQSQLIERTHTLNQYENGLGLSLDRLLIDMERQQQEQERELQRQLEQQQQLERQQELEQQQRLELELDAVDFSDPVPDLEVDFGDPVLERNRNSGIDHDYGCSR